MLASTRLSDDESVQPSMAWMGRSPMRALVVSGMQWDPTSVGCLNLPVPSYSGKAFVSVGAVTAVSCSS